MKYILYLAILVCPLIFFTDVTRNPYIIQGTILYISLLLILILFIYNSLKNKNIVLYETPLDIIIIVFSAITVLTFLKAFLVNYQIPIFGKIPGYTTAIWSEGLRNNLYILINCILAYYVAVNLIRDEKTIKRVFYISYLVAFIASIYAILQYFDIEPIWQHVVNPYGIKRCVSTFGNPVFLSSFLVIIIPVAFTTLIFSKSNFERSWHIVLLASMVLALFCTMARSSWLGLTVSFIIIAISFKDKILSLKKWILAITIIIVLVMFIPAKWQNETKTFGAYTANRIASIFSIQKSGPAAYQRFLIWLSAWDISKQNPVLGCGWGLFEMLFPFYQQRYLIHPKLTQRTHANNAHNVLLENLSQMGIIGLGIFLLLIICIVKFGIHQIKYLKNDFQKMAAVAIFAGTAGMLVDNIVNVTLYFVIPGFFFWMNLGILAGLGSNTKRIIKNNITTKIISVILIILSVILIKMYITIFIAEKSYFTGFKIAKKPNASIEQAIQYLEKAHKLHRLEVNNNYELANGYARLSAQYRYSNAFTQMEIYQKKALWAYTEAIAANPGYDELYFNLATVQAQRKEFNESIENYKKAIFINPFSMDAIMGLGNIYLFSNNYEQSINIYRRATLLSPNNKDIWNNLGYAYMKLNNINEAKKSFKRAIEIDPNFDLAKKNLINLPSQ